MHKCITATYSLCFENKNVYKVAKYSILNKI